MTLFIPMLLCIAVVGAAFFGWKKPKSDQILTSRLVATDLEERVADIRAKRDRIVQDALARGMAFLGSQVQLTCECGHAHTFDEFKRHHGGPSDRSVFLDYHNLVFHHEVHGYRGPAVEARKVGEGLGWVGTDFGCSKCRSQKFRYNVFEMNAYTSCGQHLVRRDQISCPICDAYDQAIREEMQLHGQTGLPGVRRAS